MRYRIEFLTCMTSADGVCHTADAEGELYAVEMRAFLQSRKVKSAYGANGFQIRDLEDGGVIVLLERFDDPLMRFTLSRDEVVH